MVGRLAVCCVALAMSASACAQTGGDAAGTAGEAVAGSVMPVPRPTGVGGRKVARPLPAPAGRDRIRALIARHAVERGVPADLADAVVRLESNYNPEARNGSNLGLTQISFATARAYGYGGAREGLFDPETNLTFGIRYLAEAYRLAGGDTCGTILRYQAGHRARSMTTAARRYCARVRPLLAARS